MLFFSQDLLCFTEVKLFTIKDFTYLRKIWKKKKMMLSWTSARMTIIFSAQGTELGKLILWETVAVAYDFEHR